MENYADELKYNLAVIALMAAGVLLGLSVGTAWNGPNGASVAQSHEFNAWSSKIFMTMSAGVSLACVGAFFLGKMIGYRSARGE